MDAGRDQAARQLLEAGLVPLGLSLVQLRGDLALLDRMKPFIRGPWAHQAELPHELELEILDGVSEELDRIAAGGRPRLAQVDEKTLQRMMSVAVGEAVSSEYVPMISAQLPMLSYSGPDERTDTRLVSKADAKQIDVLIVGAGVPGVCAGVKLREAGLQVEIVEKNADVGGTWFENRYPGCAVDTPNHFYEYSFFPNDDWAQYYSPREEIQKYLAKVVDELELRPCIRFDTEVTSAVFDEQHGVWHVSLLHADGNRETRTARFFITAVGQLNRPSLPKISGLESFSGTVVHTANWSGDPIGTDKRVGLIGTGASAIQVGPAIADQTSNLTVFQRSGSWIARNRNIHRDVEEGKKWALKNVPFYGNWYRFQMFWAFADGLYPILQADPEWSGDGRFINARNEKVGLAMLRYLNTTMQSRPDLIEKLTPNYPPYGKRVLADCGWYSMLKKDNVHLETDPIKHIEPDGVRLSDGRFIPLDVLVCATGFDAAQMLAPMHIAGRGGSTIRDVWGQDNPSAYLGMTIPNFPNLFVMYGPNTGLGHGGSVMFLAECQTRFILNAIELVDTKNGHTIEVRSEVHEEYLDRITAQMKGFVWSDPRVNSWYKNSGGRIIINQPGRLVDYWQQCDVLQASDYVVEVLVEQAT